MDNDFIEIVNMFQSYSLSGMNLKYVYTFYCKILPKGKRYNKYIKNKNENKFNLELVDILCDYFEESSSNILDYIELTSKDKIKYILELYGIEPKKIRKLIK
jgi:dTDP-D-glucose 4,6-dehydratase